MNKLLLAVTLFMCAPAFTFAQDSIDFEKIGIIREFGGTDNAALFGVRSNSGIFNITKIVGPGFLKTYGVGTLNQSTLAKLFSKSSKPLSQTEKTELLTNFNGGTIIYTEGYQGNLCTNDETKYEVVATGSVNAVNVEVTFQFVAQPNPNGNCTFHIFGILVRYTN